jgi:integrase
MTTFRLPFIHEFFDRHGKIRRYVRRRGFPRVSLPGIPGSAEFMAAYEGAIGSVPARPTSRYGNGTLGGLWTDYGRSACYVNLSARSRAIYRSVMQQVLAAHGHRTVAGLNRDHARKLIQEIGETTPAMANSRLSVMRLLLNFAVENGWRGDNPFMKLKRYKGGEHRSWTDQELAAYEKRWPRGTRERLVYDLLLYTAQRGSDVVTIRHSDLKTGLIPIVQKKTGTALSIPIHPALKASIKSVPKKGMYVLSDERGRSIQRQSLTRIIRISAKKAGLPPECVAHGLRKAALRRLAERGASDKQIAAVSGHRSMNEVQRYTAAADQSELAQQAMRRIPHGGRTKIGKPA